jgi:O-succinylbenzoic acid--CoA ligase
MASQVTTGKCNTGERSGCLLRHRELKIDSSGEILVKGKTLFLGYLKKTAVELPLDADGWFHTGDIGKLDRKGFLTVFGRIDNMFISGGENIHPEEIESWLLKINGVEQALVVGLPDEDFGMRPAAFVKYSDRNIVAEKEIAAELEKSLPRFKIPRIYFDWPENLAEGALKLPRAGFLKLAKEFMAKRSPQTQEVSP